jgi:hypothetical protein
VIVELLDLKRRDNGVVNVLGNCTEFIHNDGTAEKNKKHFNASSFQGQTPDVNYQKDKKKGGTRT